MLKVILAGDPKVGKTTIRLNYMGKSVKSRYMPTVGADLSVKRIGTSVLQIWDLGGQKAYETLRREYYSGVQGVIIVYDVSQPNTYKNIEKWIREITDRMDNKVPVVLVANKIDLIKDTHNNVVDDYNNYAQRLQEWSGYNVNSVITSAKTGENIETMFELLLSEINNFIKNQKKK